MIYAREDLAWAAGLFEGEGCFSAVGKRGRYGRQSARASISMTDYDIIERFADVMSFGRFHIQRASGTAPRDRKVWSVANFQHFQATVAMLWPWLGPRRRARAVELLQAANNPMVTPAERWETRRRLHP